MSNKSRCWVVFVIGYSEEYGQMLASFLSFNALNRFEALKRVEQVLPDNPKWLTRTGELLDFNILSLHQCDPAEVESYAMEYVDSFAGMFPGAVPA